MFQDMAAIPMLVAAGCWRGRRIGAVLQGSAGRRRGGGGGLPFAPPGWAAKAQLKELFTAAALLMVVGTAQLFDYAGLSAGLGGFLVGVLMAESRYRDELETAIEPFKGCCWACSSSR